MIITHCIIKDERHAVEIRGLGDIGPTIAAVAGPYDQPLFVVAQGELFLALSGHFVERAGIYKLHQMVPRRIEHKNRHVVECDSIKQEYDYDSQTHTV